MPVFGRWISEDRPFLTLPRPPLLRAPRDERGCQCYTRMMPDTTLHLDPNRAAALKDAVDSGDAASLQAAVELALDAWLAQRRFDRLSDTELSTLWAEGEASGLAGELDFACLKQEARTHRPGW